MPPDKSPDNAVHCRGLFTIKSIAASAYIQRARGQFDLKKYRGLDQQSIDAAHVGSRVIGQAALGQQRLVKHDVRQVVEVV